MTRGTMHSSLEQMNGLDVACENGAWIPDGRRPRAFVTFPPPIGRHVVARYPSGETVTVPRHVETRELIARISADPTFTASGALAPALSVDPTRFLDGLAQIGVSWRVDTPRPALTELPA